MVERIVGFVADYVALDSPVHLVYAPHPTEGEDYIARVRAAAGEHPRVHVIEKPVATTERLIIDSVAHLSVYSSCHFDAIHYKGKTFVLDVLDDNLMHYYTQRHPEAKKTVTSAAALLKHLREAS